MTVSDVAKALEAFDRNDIGVAQALVHLTADVDRDRLLAMRLAPSPRQAEDLVRPLESAMLLEHFVAGQLESTGDHAGALSVRLEALALTPRWDSWLAATMLSRTARSLRHLGRAGDALPLAERSVAFLPCEPTHVAELATTLEAAARPADAARSRAWLYDQGFGPLVIDRAVTTPEIDTEPLAPDLDALEPLDVEGMSRHLAFTYADLGLANHMAQGRRHAAACVRHGAWAAAIGTLEGYAGGTPNAHDAGRWLGVHVGASDYIAVDAFLALLESRTIVRSPKDLHHSLAGNRHNAVLALAAEGKAAAARAALFDRVAHVRYVAAAALPTDPVVVRTQALEPESGRLLFASPTLPEGLLVSHAHHDGSRFRLGDLEIEYPVPPSSTWPIERHTPHIERTPNARSKCKVCKGALAAGDLRLRVRQKMFPVETFYVHLACAGRGKKGPLLGDDKKAGPLLLQALQRTRILIPDRAALEAACR